jgi:WD40 repeat protein
LASRFWSSFIEDWDRLLDGRRESRTPLIPDVRVRVQPDRKDEFARGASIPQVHAIEIIGDGSFGDGLAEFCAGHDTVAQMRSLWFKFCAGAASLLLAAGVVNAQLRGHGGPVRALAVSADGKTAISGSFDTSAIRWSLERNAAEAVLRFHGGAVNAVALLGDGRVVTSGDDARIAIWTHSEQTPRTVLEGHRAPVAALAVSGDGALLASASWDHTARLWPVGGGAPRALEGHSQNVNGVAFTPDGRAVVTVGYDATLRIWPVAGSDAPTIVRLPAPLNAVAVAPDGEIVTAGSDGKVYVLSRAGELRGEIQVVDGPVLAMALSPDGKRIAAAGIRGTIAIIDRAARRSEREVVAPGLSVWSAAFLPDNRTRGSCDPPLGHDDRRAHGRSGECGDRRSAGGLCGRSRRGGVSRLHRLSRAAAGPRRSRRPDPGRHFRAPDRDLAGI